MNLNRFFWLFMADRDYLYFISMPVLSTMMAHSHGSKKEMRSAGHSEATQLGESLFLGAVRERAKWY